MRPFKLFFGIALAIILLSLVARVVIFAFIAAAIMSIVYAVYRRLKDFVTYDSFGEYYLPQYKTSRIRSYPNNEVEPLFKESYSRQRGPIGNIKFIDAL